jgi:hypothetical protein
MERWVTMKGFRNYLALVGGSRGARPTLRRKKLCVEPFIVGLRPTPVNMASSDIIQVLPAEVMWCVDLESLPTRFTFC